MPKSEKLRVQVYESDLRMTPVIPYLRDTLRHIRFAYEKLFMFHKMIRDGIWIINDVVISNNDDEVNIFSWSWIYDNQVYVIIINNSDKVINSAIEFNFKHDLFNNNRLNYYDHYNSTNSRVSSINNSINWISKPYGINLLEFNQNIDL